MGRLDEAKKVIEELYQKHDMVVIMEAMQIVNKYASEEGRLIMENNIRVLQEDSVKLVSINFYLQTLAGNADGDAGQAKKARKFQYAKYWTDTKKNEPKITQGALDQLAEVAIKDYSEAEIEAQRKADMFRAAVDSVTDVVNMLKKVVERLMWQGSQQPNL